MRQLLPLVIIMLVIGLAYTIIRWPGGMHMTFSQHAAASRWSKVYYSLLFIVTLPLLFWFFASWLIPAKDLPIAFLWFAGVAALFQILCTWFPEEGGRRTTIHRVLTGISGVAMLPQMLILATAAGIPNPVRALAWTGLVFMVALLGVALMNQRGFRWALLLQVGYYAMFFAVLSAVTYS